MVAAGLFVSSATATTPSTPSSSTSTDEWPTALHGVDRNAWNPDESTISPTNVGTLALQWSVSTGATVASAPSVVDGTVYVGSRDGIVRAIDAATGTVSWTFTADDWVDFSPAVADGRVFVGAVSGSFYALDAATGEQLWSLDLGTNPRNPAVVDGAVYIATNDDVVALDASTGDELWRRAGPEGAMLGDLAVDATGGTLIASSSKIFDEGTIFALSLDDGATVWSTPVEAPINAPSVANGTAYVVGYKATVFAVAADTGAIRWQHQMMAHSGPDVWPGGTPVVVGNRVYAQGGSAVHELDAATGTELWAGYEHAGQLVVANGLLFHGGLYVTDLATHELVTAKDLPPIENAFTASVVVDGMVILGTDGGKILAYAPEGPVPTVPDAPGGMYVTSGDKQALVEWSRPIWNGGAPIASYTVTASPGGASCSTTGALSCTVPNLSPVGLYTFSVTATNSVGTSVARTSQAWVYSAPSAPMNVSATTKSGKVLVEWTAPGSTGGTPITGFTATASPGGKQCETSTWSCEIAGLTNGTAYTISVTAQNQAGTGPPATTGPVTPLGYVALPAPARLLDTRPGQSTVDGQSAGIGKVHSGAPLALAVAGRAGVPAIASSVVLNVTVTEPNLAGNVTVYPCGGEVPLASNINFTPGQTVPNAVIAKVGTAGKVCFNTTSTTHLVVDVSGYFTDTQTYTPLSSPARLMESRVGYSSYDGMYSGFGPLAAGVPQQLQVTNRAGVPPSATSVVLNVTVTEPTTAGNVTVYACGQSVPLASNLNFTPGQTVANAVITKVSHDGLVCLNSTSSTHLVVDIAGYFMGTDTFVARSAPARLLDTRPGQLTVDGQGAGIGKLSPGMPLQLSVNGRAGLPADAPSVVLNVTVTQPSAVGNVTVYPCGQPVPLASNLNFTPGQTVPNAVITRVGAAGTVCFNSTASTHLVVDVEGSFN